MPDSVAQRRADRSAFLLAAYELVDGRLSGSTSWQVLSERLELDGAYASELLNWCDTHGYVDRRNMAGGFSLNARGIDEAERLLDAGAQVPASLLVLTLAEMKAVEAFLSELRRSEVLDRLPAEEHADAQAQVATVDAQLRSPRPRRRIVRIALRETYGLLHGASGNAVFELLKKALEAIG